VRKHFWTADLLCTRSPVAVTLDSAGRIYVADNEYFAGALVRVDDMTGANWTSIYFGPKGTAGPNSIAVDRNGTVFAGGGIGGSVKLVDSMLGVLNSSSSWRIWKVTAGCVMHKASAALVKDRCFATA